MNILNYLNDITKGRRKACMHLAITPYALPPQLGQWCKFRLQHFLPPQSKSGNGFRIVFFGVRFGLLMSYARIHVGYTDLSVHIYILESIGSCPEKQHPRAWPPLSGLCPSLSLPLKTLPVLLGLYRVRSVFT